MSEENWINKAIDWVKQKGFTNIKAEVADFEPPLRPILLAKKGIKRIM